METFLEVLDVVGAWPLIGIGLGWVFLTFFRPLERDFRRLERLAALRSTLGDRASAFDGDIDELVARVAERQKDVEVRPWQWVSGIGGAIATASGVFAIWRSITGTPEMLGFEVGDAGRPYAIGFWVCLTIAAALMTVGSVVWDVRHTVELRADLRKMKRRQPAGAEGVAEGDVSAD